MYRRPRLAAGTVVMGGAVRGMEKEAQKIQT